MNGIPFGKLLENYSMNLATAIEGGLTGVSTITLLQEAISKIDPKTPPQSLLGKPGLLRKIKRKTKKGKNPTKLYIRLGTELLSGAAYYGLTAIGKKKNAVLRGALLGLGAGAATVWLKSANNDEAEESDDSLRSRILTVALYTSAGMLAGYAVKKWGKNASSKK